ncbi:hypothetical protein TCAL_01930 [Tigriopus californicus]|uniref:Protocadherin-16 n=1 Tax=Tigriopus californicus TaxID=6832 RepID=A0A553P7L0_TIGCA|nr:hypothetical protein TCAL_01930 [Tigriopus californicus]
MIRQYLLIMAVTSPILGEFLRTFEVKEGVPIGTIIGVIGETKPGLPPPPQPPYLIVPLPGSDPDRDLIINQQSGEIRTKQVLDREKTPMYTISAIPINGESVQVVITVQDVNDNTPKFPSDEVFIDIPENTPKGTRRKLSLAEDEDLGVFGTQRYDIVSGNEEGVFLLAVDQSLELIVNGELDRERVDKYHLKVSAVDGGSPPRTGTLTVNIKIQDLNDNPPLFGKQRYFTTIPDNLPSGSSILTVEARDSDTGANAEISYSINRRQSDQSEIFTIDDKSGVISLEGNLDFERKQVHEIVVVAKDNGEVVQETSAFITVRLTHGSSNLEPILREPTPASHNEDKLNLVFHDEVEGVPENLQLGHSVAQVLLSDPSLDMNAFNFDLTLGGDLFLLTKNFSGLFLTPKKHVNLGDRQTVLVSFDVTNPSDPGRSFQEGINIPVIDTNDHAPEFDQTLYEISIDESLNPGSSIFQVQAIDLDNGNNGRISYSFDYGPNSSSFTSWFAIDASSGVISTQTFLDCETESQPRIVIMASDHGSPKLSATTTLSVSVSDVNDNQPLFESSFYEAALPEDKRIGECFLKVLATDLDCGSNSEIEYSIKEANINTFRIDKTSGQICLAQQLDHETQDMFGFTVIASDKGGLSTSTMVKVEVIDTNDNIPEFKPNFYQAKIRSRFQPGIGIVTVAAGDTDSGQAGRITFSILSGNDNNQFQIDPKSGLVSLKEPLPADFPPSFHLAIRASDGDGQQDVSSAHVEIMVDDDDLSFDMPQYKFDILEDVSPYSVIGQINARTDASASAKFSLLDSNVEDYVSVDPRTGTIRSESRLDHEMSEDFPVGSVIYVGKALDFDSGPNGEVSYSLVQNPDDMFTIEKETGQLILQKPLDYETKTEYLVVIEAEDHGEPPLKSTLKLHLHVHDTNDNTPEFEQSLYEIDLSETHAMNTPILTVKAKDKDGGRNGKISYEVSANDYVGILQHSGVLILKRHLDREIKKLLAIEVTARDNGTPPLKSQTKVRFSVSDRNDNSPEFKEGQYEFKTVENLPAGTLVGQVEAQDRDEGNNGVVEFGFKTPVSNFVIDRENGQISSSRSLDREDIANYELTVEALDRGSPRRSSQTLVKIEVEDVNDNAPKLVEPSTKMISVKRGSRAGTVIGRLDAIDVDEPDMGVNFEISDPNSFVSVGSQSGELRLARPIPISTPVSQTYYTDISISDHGQPRKRITETLTIMVVSETEDLQVVNQVSKNFDVDLTAIVGQKVGTISSGSASRRLYLEILDKTNELPFLLDASTGSLYVVKPLESLQKWNFEVLISSLIGDITPIQVSVSVKVIDSHRQRPKFIQDPTTVAIREDAEIGSKMLGLRDLIEDGASQNIEFEIIEQSKSQHFRLEGDSLVLAQELNYEKNQKHLLLIRGFDNRLRYSSDVTVLVTVTDVNDNVPMFLSSSTIHIPADSSTNQIIMNLLVVDEDSDSNGEVQMAITSGNEEGLFSLSEFGELKLMHQPQPGSYRLTFSATDLGDPPLSSKHNLDVVVGESQDRSARFQQSVYYANVTENEPSGLTVLTVGLNSRGRDLQFLEYNLLKGKDSFAIDSTTGTIETIASLDREAQDIHALIVSVSDQGHTGITDTALVYISINDLNDNAPKFGPSCRDVVIPENANHSFIHAFIANDADSGDNGKISYGLDGEFLDSNGKEQFRIERDTGKLYAVPLDREEKSEYKLDVIAVDNGAEKKSSKCSILVKISDVNDNAPSFTQSIYSASVKEEIEIGTEVLRVLATDLDDGINSEIFYSIENSTESSFAINEKTGAIVNSKSLNRELQTEHRFQILATDGAKGSIMSSLTQIRIIVTDANDHEPMFVEFPFYVNMTATPTSGIPLLRLVAFDPDTGPNGQLTYDIVRPDQRQLFELSPEAGILTVAAPDIAWEPGTVEMLEIAVSDAGSPPKSSTGLVEIKIEGGPAIMLQFQEQVYKVTLTENTPVGTDVTQVKALRSDGRRQRVVYNFLRGNEGRAFEINSNNGLIRVRDSRLIDYEKNPSFNLTISAQSLTDESLTAYTSCLVEITDVNDNVPRFGREVYMVKILESQPRHTPLLTAKAFDSDPNQTDQLKYEIIDGNVDGAFLMDTTNPGVILTNIVLDREIADHYELTISATDTGSPALVGLAQVLVEVVDVNDNQPHFAPLRPISIKRDVPTGTVVATIRANDIDIAPPVTYRLKVPSDYFSIDTYTGQLILMSFPSKIEGQTLTLELLASDGLFEAQSSVDVTFEKGNRKCQPKFSQPLYNFYYSINESFPTMIGDVALDACDATSEFELSRESRILYSLFPNGSISLAKLPYEDINSFIITAVDRKSRKGDSAVVTVAKNDGNVKLVEFASRETEIIVIPQDYHSNALTKIETNQDGNQGLFFSISDNAFLDIDSATGAIYQKPPSPSRSNPNNMADDVIVRVKKLGERQVKQKRIQVQLPQTEQVVFASTEKSFSVPEDAQIGFQMDICPIKSKSKFTPFVKILSGDSDNVFKFNEKTLQVVLSKQLDFETERSYELVLRMGSLASFSLCKIQINVMDVNDFTPKFLTPKYVTKVRENLDAGTKLPPPHVFDFDQDDGLRFWGGTTEFEVNRNTGEIITKTSFDYESENQFNFDYFVNDTAGHQAQCQVTVLIEGQDEFEPTFEKDNYFFALPGVSNVGDVVGQVRARDRDGGPDGVITFEFVSSNEYFTIDSLRGVITIAKALDTGVFHYNNVVRRKRSLKDLELGVKAKSKKSDSLEGFSTVVVSMDEELLPLAAHNSGGLGAAVQGVIVAVIILLVIIIAAILFICHKRNMAEKRKSNHLANLAGHANPNMTLEMSTSSDALSRFPPQYSEIVSDYERAKNKTYSSGNPRSELSEKSHRSASSGRGSVEDGDDEVDVEIRMINAGSYLATDSAFAHDDDKLSEGSVQNTEDYLARLGIDMRKPPNMNVPSLASVSGDMLHNFDNTYAGGSSIYNRIPEDALSEKNSVLSAKHSSMIYGSNLRGQPSLTGSLSSIVHSEEELAGSYNWDYLLDWGPQYQSLSHVFKEISKLKDEEPTTNSVAHPNPSGLSVSATGVLSASGAKMGTHGSSHLSGMGGSSGTDFPFGKNPRTSHLLNRSSRSPISHDMLSHKALSPNFHPALSPLATKSPSISPMSVPVQRSGALHLKKHM